MNGTFPERIAALIARTHCGEGILSGSVEVDQPYAHAQHEHLEYHHPRGGRAKFLWLPLVETYQLMLADIARTYLDDGGTRAMAGSMDRLSDLVVVNAPREFEVLRFSGHARVERGGKLIYDRPPHRSRLSAAQLEAEEMLTYPGLPGAIKGWIWWHLQRHTHPPAGSGWAGRGR